MEWLKALASALLALLKEPLTQLAAFLAGRRQGELEQKSAQDEADKEALQRGADAGASVRTDPDSLRGSENNRDNW